VIDPALRHGAAPAAGSRAERRAQIRTQSAPGARTLPYIVDGEGGGTTPHPGWGSGLGSGEGAVAR
jgi:hypothetical protein